MTPHDSLQDASKTLQATKETFQQHLTRAMRLVDDPDRLPESLPPRSLALHAGQSLRGLHLIER